MSANTFNGLEYVYNYHKNDLNKDADALSVFFHWYLVHNGFKCLTKDGKQTEILPQDWKADENTYIVNYTKDSKGYQLKMVVVDQHFMVNLARLKDERVASLTFTTSDHVIGFNNEYERVYKHLQDLCDKLKTEFEALFKTEVVVTTEQKRTRSPERQREPLLSGAAILSDPLRVRPRINPRDYGRSDLDPFAFDPLARGGMVYDPMRNNPMFQPRFPSDLPRGSVPPGARFDPTQPPNPDAFIPGSSRMEPNPDHLRPPGYDDMFM